MAGPDSDSDSDRGNNPAEPLDPRVVDAALDEDVHVSDASPASGGAPGTIPGAPVTTQGARGSTGRNAIDSGRPDAGGEPGGGMAGSSGG